MIIILESKVFELFKSNLSRLKVFIIIFKFSFVHIKMYFPYVTKGNHGITYSRIKI